MMREPRHIGRWRRLASGLGALCLVAGCGESSTEVPVPVDGQPDGVVDSTPPSWPTGAELEQVQLSPVRVRWPAADDDVGVQSYVITVDGVDSAVVGAGVFESELPYAQVGATVDVRAQDAAGNDSSALTLVVAADGEAGPRFPVGASLVVTERTETALALAWPEAAFAGGDVLYRVSVDPSAQALELTETHVTVTGLSPGQRYELTVLATTQAGAVGDTLSVTAETLDETAPTWPEGAAGTWETLSDGTVVVRFPEALDAVGVVEYRVTEDKALVGDGVPGGGTTVSVVVASSTVPGVRTLEVVAFDGAGNRSEPLPVIIDPDDTTPPGWALGDELLVSDLGAQSLTLGWPPAADDGDTLSYQVWRDDELIATVGSTYVTVADLAPWTTYVMSVSAVDAGNNVSPVALSVTVTTLDVVAPSFGPDGQLVATTLTPEVATVTWTPATDDVAVVGYRVFRDGVERAWLGAETTSWTETGLTPWTMYTLEVVAEDAAGNLSEPGVSLELTTPDAGTPVFPPGAAISVDSVTSETAQLSWTAASDDVGIAGYSVWMEGVEVLSVDGETLSAVLDGLAPAQSYSVVVHAVDASGNQTPVGLSVTVVTPDTSAPVWPVGAALVVGAVQSTSVVLSWPDATDDVGVVEYVVSVDGAEAATFDAQVTSGTIGGLIPSHTALVVVTARDAAGNTSAGLSATVTTPDGGAPTWPADAVLTVGATATTLTLSWPPAEDDVAVTGYRVRVDDAIVVLLPAEATTYTVTDLQAETTYALEVEATDATGTWTDDGLSASGVTSSLYDPGFTRLSEEQFLRSLADLHGAIWMPAHAKVGADQDWVRDSAHWYATFTQSGWGYWGDFRNAYPPDAYTAGPGEPRGGYRRLDQLVFDEHLTSWIGAIMRIGADYEEWVGHYVIFQACVVDNNNGVTNFATPEEVTSNCVDQFIHDFGRLAFRRPLTDAEKADFRAVYDDSEAEYADVTFTHWSGYGWRARGLRNVIAAINASPEFLYRVELGDESGALTGWELASRLSYHFWNTMPDEELMAAAESGALLTEAGYQAQVDRLADDPRAQRVIDEFYRDFFRVQDIPDVTAQDGPAAYVGGPSWTSTNGAFSNIKGAMEDELANLGQWFTSTAPGTYAEMFQSNLHFLQCQDVPWEPETCFGAGPYSQASLGFDGWDGWDGVSPPVQMPEPERAGLLTRMALLAHDTVYARPIRRGLYIREALLCDPIPPPESCDVVKPPEIDVYMTVRERVEAITEQPGTSCAGCHTTFINGFGHALGHFNSQGGYWATERMFSDQTDGNGNYWYFLLPEDQWAEIDDTGEAFFDGAWHTIHGPGELSELLVNSGQLEWCWSREYFRFALGRHERDSDQATIEALADQMRQGATLAAAWRQIAHTPQFKTLDKPIGSYESAGGQP